MLHFSISSSHRLITKSFTIIGQKSIFPYSLYHQLNGSHLNGSFLSTTNRSLSEFSFFSLNEAKAELEMHKLRKEAEEKAKERKYAMDILSDDVLLQQWKMETIERISAKILKSQERSMERSKLLK